MPTAGEFKHEPFGIPCQCFVKRRTRRINCMKSCLRSNSSEPSSSGHRANDKHKKVTFNPILSVCNYDDEIILDIDKDTHRWKYEHLEPDKVESCSSPPENYAVTPTPFDIKLTIEHPEKLAEDRVACNTVDITVACVNSTRRSKDTSGLPSVTISPLVTACDESPDRLDGSSLNT